MGPGCPCTATCTAPVSPGSVWARGHNMRVESGLQQRLRIARPVSVWSVGGVVHIEGRRHWRFRVEHGLGSYRLERIA